MSRTNQARTTTTKNPASQPKPKASTRPGRVIGRPGKDEEKWRCNACTFLSEGDVCGTCGAPKGAPPPKRKQPNPDARSPQPREERKQIATISYYDRTDDSENVPIAGIKKYHHKPAKKPPKAQKGLRDIIGELQAASSDEPLPCMRKKKSP
mmetsp:Transcript_2147/g.5394  ORF Transcript_2147/g.5394 Transcript_2147/m.5394 type:complete len:152 (-) Transcript_2147:351-806(-)